MSQKECQIWKFSKLTGFVTCFYVDWASLYKEFFVIYLTAFACLLYEQKPHLNVKAAAVEGGVKRFTVSVNIPVNTAMD